MNSGATIARMNQEKFLTLLQQFDPELYLIKYALIETKVSPSIILPIIRTIANLTIGTGYGKVQIYMQARVITQIKPEESVEINQKAIIE